MSYRAFHIAILLATAGLAMAATPAGIPHRKAGWWQMTVHLPGGRTMVRNLCLDAESDIRNNILKPEDGCTINVTPVPGGYGYRKTCGTQVTTGSATGDFNSAYTIHETRGSTSIDTDARWNGQCPAGKKPDEMWF
jgi:Protein of unknown function (DUF3617)